MGREEWNKWLKDAMVCLMLKYTEEQARIVVDWMDTIRGRKERDLMGDEIVDRLCAGMSQKHYSTYDSMMSRMWVYAPFILEEAGKLPMKKLTDCITTCLAVKQGSFGTKPCEERCAYMAQPN